MDAVRPLFCEDCLAAMPRLSPDDRCRYCFQLVEEPLPVCKSCRLTCAHPLRFAGVFSYDSPAVFLVKQLKYGGRQELAPILASWMIVQLQELGFPWPDAVIAVPQSPLRRFVRGYNPSDQLASSMSKMMKVPLLRPLKRIWAAMPQAGKTLEERTQMSKGEFLLRPSVSLIEKTVLIVDDVITTGTTLKRCAEALQPAFPSAIYGLGFLLA
jgi:competence protein ComFC